MGNGGLEPAIIVYVYMLMSLYIGTVDCKSNQNLNCKHIKWDRKRTDQRWCFSDVSSDERPYSLAEKICIRNNAQLSSGRHSFPNMESNHTFYPKSIWIGIRFERRTLKWHWVDDMEVLTDWVFLQKIATLVTGLFVSK